MPCVRRSRLLSVRSRSGQVLRSGVQFPGMSHPVQSRYTVIVWSSDRIMLIALSRWQMRPSNLGQLDG